MGKSRARYTDCARWICCSCERPGKETLMTESSPTPAVARNRGVDDHPRPRRADPVSVQSLDGSPTRHAPVCSTRLRDAVIHNLAGPRAGGAWRVRVAWDDGAEAPLHGLHRAVTDPLVCTTGRPGDHLPRSRRQDRDAALPGPGQHRQGAYPCRRGRLARALRAPRRAGGRASDAGLRRRR